MEIREVLKQWFTIEAINAMDGAVFDELPEDEGVQVTILISGKGELDGIDLT